MLHSDASAEIRNRCDLGKLVEPLTVYNTCEYFLCFTTLLSLRRENEKRKREKKGKEGKKEKCMAAGTRRDWNKRIDLTDWCADGISSAREPPHQPLNRIKRNCNVAVIIRSRSRYCRERAVDAARFIAPIDFVVSLAIVNKNASLIS